MPEQVVITSPRRTELVPFILDILDFMDEKISEAVADETSRRGAVSEAAGVVPLLRDRLRENEVVQASSFWCSANIFTDRTLRSGGRYWPVLTPCGLILI
jgi:hypothetical protein